MSAVTRSELRRLTAAQIVATLPEWKVAPVPFDSFDVSTVPDAIPASIAHLCFSVGVKGTKDTHRNRSTATEGALAESEVRIKFLFRLSPSDKVGSADAADDAGHAAIKAVCEQSATWPGTMTASFLWESTSGSVNSSGEWHTGEIVYTVLHRFALS